MSKKGIITEFFALILIVGILGLFFVFGKMATTFEKDQGGLVVLDEDEVEIANMFDYVESYVVLQEKWTEFYLKWGAGG